MMSKVEVNKQIYICPNNPNKNRNVRIDDQGTEIILNHKLNPWIIANIFKIKGPKSGALDSKSKQESFNSVQLMKIKNDMTNLRREMNLMSSKFKRKKHE